MDMRCCPAAEAASWRNIAYPTEGDVVDPVFNRVCLVLSVCPLSAVAVWVTVWESVVISVRLDPQHYDLGLFSHQTTKDYRAPRDNSGRAARTTSPQTMRDPTDQGAPTGCTTRFGGRCGGGRGGRGSGRG